MLGMRRQKLAIKYQREVLVGTPIVENSVLFNCGLGMTAFDPNQSFGLLESSRSKIMEFKVIDHALDPRKISSELKYASPVQNPYTKFVHRCIESS